MRHSEDLQLDLCFTILAFRSPQVSVKRTGHAPTLVLFASSSVFQSTTSLSCLNPWEYVLQLLDDVLVPKVLRTLLPPADEGTARWEEERMGGKFHKDGRESGSAGPQPSSFLGMNRPFETRLRLPSAITLTGARCCSRNNKANFCWGLVN